MKTHFFTKFFPPPSFTNTSRAAPDLPLPAAHAYFPRRSVVGRGSWGFVAKSGQSLRDKTRQCFEKTRRIFFSGKGLGAGRGTWPGTDGGGLCWMIRGEKRKKNWRVISPVSVQRAGPNQATGGGGRCPVWDNLFWGVRAQNPFFYLFFFFLQK